MSLENSGVFESAVLFKYWIRNSCSSRPSQSIKFDLSICVFVFLGITEPPYLLQQQPATNHLNIDIPDYPHHSYQVDNNRMQNFAPLFQLRPHPHDIMFLTWLDVV